MKRLSSVLLVGLLAACSSKDDGKEGTTDADGSNCPATVSEGAACTKEGRICEYSYALTCPMGCSGGDYHSTQCSKGRWVDYAHSAGAPQCYCGALDFPTDMQGTWRFNDVGSPEAYAWVRFSALGDTTSGSGTPGQGTIQILSGPAAPTNSIPWWSCSGEGLWFITQRPQTFEVRPPSTCAGASTSEIYTVTASQGDIPVSQRGCLLHIAMDSTAATPVEACKYSDTQCDAAMKTCQTQ